MAATLGELAVLLTANNAKLTSAVEDSKGKLAGLQSVMRTTVNVAGGIFAGMAGAIGLATAALGEQREAELRLASVAGLQGIDVGRIHEYAAALQGVTTFGDEATISATAMLASFSLTEDELISLMPRMQNLAAFAKQDLNQVAMQMGKAFTMGASSLSRMGIVMTEVQKEAFDAADQMGKVAIMAQVIDQNVGNAAETMASTTVGAFVQMKNAAGDTLEELGKLVEVPLRAVFQATTTVIEGVTAAFAGLSPGTKTFLGTAALVVTAVAGLAVVVGTLTLAFSSLGIAIFAAVLVPLGIVIGVLAALAGVAAIVVMWVAVIRKAWTEDLWGMRTAVGDAVGWIEGRWKSYVNRLAEDWEGFTKAIGGAWESVSSYLMETLRSVVDWLIGDFRRLGTFALEVLEKISPAAAAAVSEFMAGEGAALPIIKAFGLIKETAVDAASAAGDAAVASVAAVNDVVDTGVDALGDLAEAGGDAAGFVGDAFGDMADDIIEALGLTSDAADEMKKKPQPPGAGVTPPTGVGPAGAGPAEALAGAFWAGDGAGGGAGLPEPTVNGVPLTDFWGSVGATAEGVLSQIGDLGGLISTGMQAFQAGGPYAAAIAVFADLAMQTEAFGDIIDDVNATVGTVIDAIEPLIVALQGVVSTILTSLAPVVKTLSGIIEALVVNAIGPWFTAIGSLVAAIAPILEILMLVLSPVLEVLGVAMRVFAIIAGAVAVAIGWVVNAVIDVITEILTIIADIGSAFGDTSDIREFAQTIRASRINMEDLTDALEAAATGTTVVRAPLPVAETPGERAAAQAALLAATTPWAAAAAAAAERQAEMAAAWGATQTATSDAVGGLGDAADDTAESFREVSASLANIPEGFRIAAERFGAISVGDGGAAGLSAGGNTIIFQANDALEIHEKLKELDREDQVFGGLSPSDDKPNAVDRMGS